MDGWTVAPNVFCYSEMLQALRWELALQLFQAMDGTAEKVLGYNTLLSSFHAASKWQLALETFAMSQALVTADMVNFVCAVNSYVKGRQQKSLLGVLQDVSSLAVGTIQEGWDIFAVRCGGVCASALDAQSWYRFNGASTVCDRGRGGLTANSARGSVPALRIGNFYVIAGQALTTQAQAEEKPRAGYFGRAAKCSFGMAKAVKLIED
eukprot:Skav230565  [mRNA]  locus=scaffold1941:15062:19275:- [translate_table: standard]